MNILLRHAEDDFAALQIATAMEKAGATVFSITSNGERKHPMAVDPHTRFIVWAKHDDQFSIDRMDELILSANCQTER